MQEDKNLKELLMKWAIETPPADFTNGVMQRVTSAYNFNTHTQSLLRQRVPQVLLALFVLVCIVLLALSFTRDVSALLLQFTVKLPAKYLLESFQFLIAFWIVMLLNMGVKKYAVGRW